MWHSPFKLHLYPEKPDYSFDNESLISCLKNIKFIDSEISESRFTTGDELVSLLTFMGCSPNIELEPQDDKPYCYIEIENYETIQLKAGKNLKPAKCPNCKSAIKTFIRKHESHFECPECSNEYDFHKLNWRKSAFMAKCWITIGNIYESEAIPSDQLLLALQSETNQKWKYAYIREDVNEDTE